MASFFQKTGWTNLKKAHDLDNGDPCVKKMNDALTAFHAVDEDVLNVNDVSELIKGMEKFRECMKKSENLSVKNMIEEMMTEAKDFRNKLRSMIKKSMA